MNKQLNSMLDDMGILNSPYLVQRCKFRKDIKDPKNIKLNPFSGGGGPAGGSAIKGPIAITTIDKLMAFDYMGAAEYEFGALPNTISKIYIEKDKYKIFTINEIKNRNKEPLQLYCQEEQKDYLTLWLKQLAKDKMRLKESAHFHFHIIDKDKLPEYYHDIGLQINAWFNIDSHFGFFFTFDNENMKLVPNAIYETGQKIKLIKV